MKDYSQSGEQVVITRYFTGRPRGTLLSVGENDGEIFSMSRALMLDGWRGVLVEPSPTAFARLSHLYQDRIEVHDSTDVDCLPFATCVQAAITTSDGPIDLYDSGTHLKKGDVALLSTTVPAEMDRWKKSGEQFTKTSVRGITFATLMKEAGVNHFDFISIDAEGADWSILRQINLEDVGCQLLCIEYNQRAVDAMSFTNYARNFGMKLHARTYENLIFAR